MRSNTIRKIAGVWIVLALVLALVPRAYAEVESQPSDSQLFIEGGNTSGSVFQLLFYCDAPEAPSLDNISITVNGQEITPKSVNPLSYADPGTSYLMLFDTNTAVTERALPDMQKFARSIVDGLGVQDNALIAALGDKVAADDFSDDPETLASKIDSLQRNTEGQDLYSSMYNALKLLSESDRLHARKCLIVMADGLDNQVSGISQMELSALVEEAQIPVCVVALTYNTQTEARIQAAKTIGGFARLSPGGLSILLTTGSSSASDAANQILARKDKTYLAVFDSTALRALTEENEADFCIALTFGDSQLTAQRRLSIAALPAAATPEPDAGATATPAAATPEPADDISALWAGVTSLPGWVFWTAGAVLAALIALIVLLSAAAAKRRRKAASAGTIVHFNATSEDSANAGEPDICIVRLGADEQICCQMRMPAKLVIGGDSKRAQLALPGDSSISPAQCRLVWRGGSLWVEEMSRKNRTLLNGSVLNEASIVNSGDILRLGAYDYRVFWEKR